MSKQCCDSEQGKTSKSHFTVGLLGNPNCGKSTLFNHLTGARQRIGNWPGVTVDRKIGQFKFNNIDFDIVDLPGVYSLDNSARSLDEKITRDYILSSEPDVIINLVDASNLERNLYLSGQLLEMQVPMVLVLNMMDVAHSHDLVIDTEILAEKFGCHSKPKFLKKPCPIIPRLSMLSVSYWRIFPRTSIACMLIVAGWPHRSWMAIRASRTLR